MKSLVLFNNKGGVGKTTLTFNIAHMMARNGLRVVVIDCDPQCNISAILLDEESLFDLWNSGANENKNHANKTVAGCIDLVRRGKGDVRQPELTEVAENLWLLPGHLDLSRFEQTLAEEWPKKSDTNNERSLDVTTAFDVLSNLAAEAANADLVMIDVGPSLGALNRSALLACDAVILPLAPDLFSLQGMKNVGPSLREWRQEWTNVRKNYMKGRPQESLPPHEFLPIGYIVQQHLARVDRPVTGYARWASQIPAVYHRVVREDASVNADLRIDDDPDCIASIKHFASLVPIAQNARKPIFDLKQADGIGGGQIQSVAAARTDFKKLAQDVAKRIGLKKF